MQSSVVNHPLPFCRRPGLPPCPPESATGRTTLCPPAEPPLDPLDPVEPPEPGFQPGSNRNRRRGRGRRSRQSSPAGARAPLCPCWPPELPLCPCASRASACPCSPPSLPLLPLLARTAATSPCSPPDSPCDLVAPAGPRYPARVGHPTAGRRRILIVECEIILLVTRRRPKLVNRARRSRRIGTRLWIGNFDTDRARRACHLMLPPDPAAARRQPAAAVAANAVARHERQLHPGRRGHEIAATETTLGPTTGGGKTDAPTAVAARVIPRLRASCLQRIGVYKPPMPIRSDSRNIAIQLCAWEHHTKYGRSNARAV